MPSPHVLRTVKRTLPSASLSIANDQPESTTNEQVHKRATEFETALAPLNEIDSGDTSSDLMDAERITSEEENGSTAEHEATGAASEAFSGRSIAHSDGSEDEDDHQTSASRLRSAGRPRPGAPTVVKVNGEFINVRSPRDGRQTRKDGRPLKGFRGQYQSNIYLTGNRGTFDQVLGLDRQPRLTPDQLENLEKGTPDYAGIPQSPGDRGYEPGPSDSDLDSDCEIKQRKRKRPRAPRNESQASARPIRRLRKDDLEAEQATEGSSGSAELGTISNLAPNDNENVVGDRQIGDAGIAAAVPPQQIVSIIPAIPLRDQCCC